MMRIWWCNETTVAVEGRSQAVTMVMYTVTVSEGRGGGYVWLGRSLPSRPELFAGLCILGFANGIAGRVHFSVIRDGAALALANTFSISAIVWIALVACPVLLLRAPREPPTGADLTIAACALAAFMLPLDPLSWVALTMLALYILRDTLFACTKFRPGPVSFAHRGAWVLLATTVVMLWAKLLLAIASDMVLRLDAILVGWFSGTRRVGNLDRAALLLGRQRLARSPLLDTICPGSRPALDYGQCGLVPAGLPRRCRHQCRQDWFDGS